MVGGCLWCVLIQAEDRIRDSSGAGVQTCVFFFQAEDGIRDSSVTGVQTCALPIYPPLDFLPPATRSSTSSATCSAARNQAEDRRAANRRIRSISSKDSFTDHLIRREGAARFACTIPRVTAASPKRCATRSSA